MNESENKGILHKMNNKTEVRIGPFFVDGYDPEGQECFEFFGCYYHGHNCTEWKDKKKQKERYESTMERLSYLEKAGYSVYYIWQCEFDRQIGENDDLAQFMKNRRPIFSQKYPGMCTMSNILDAVIADEFFGFLEVDIQIPDKWDDVKYKPKTDLCPRDFYDKFAPIFVTCDIPFESIGEHMKTMQLNINYLQLHEHF